MKSFYNIRFTEYPYIDETSWLLILGLSFFPFIMFTHFCWIPYAANDITPSVKNMKCCKRKEKLVCQKKGL